MADLPVLTSDRRLLTLFLGLCSCFWPFFCWLKTQVFSKMPVNLIQYRRTVETFNSQHFVFDLKHKPVFANYHSNIFSHYACFFRNSVLLFLFLALFLALKVNSCKRSNNWKQEEKNRKRRRRRKQEEENNHLSLLLSLKLGD